MEENKGMGEALPARLAACWRRLNRPLPHSTAPFAISSVLLLLSFYHGIAYGELRQGQEVKLFWAKALLFGASFLLSRRLCIFIHDCRTGGIDRESKLFLALFAVSVAWLGFWLLGLWPGLYMTDSYATLKSMYTLYFDSWFSPLHPLIYLSLYQFFPNAAVVPLFQILLTASVLAYALTRLNKLGLSAGLTWILLALLLVNIPVIALTLLLTRDTIFSMAFLFLALWLFFHLLDPARVTPSARTLIPLSALILFLSIYRGEGALLILVVPLLLRLNNKLDSVRALVFAFLLFVALQAAKSSVPVALAVDDRNSISYQVSLMMNPLGHLLQHDYATASREQDYALLGTLLHDIEKVKEVSIPYEIPAYWLGYCRNDISRENFARVSALFRRMILDNVPLFLSNRVLCLTGSLGQRPRGFTYADLIRDGRRFENFAPIYAEPLHETIAPALSQWQSKILSYSATHTGARFSPKGVVWNFLPELALTLLALLLFRLYPATASASLVILCRVPLVFLAAPASQFKYYYSLYLFGFFVIFLLAVEHKVASARRRAGLPSAGE